jgi:hypothetical protein
MKRLVPLFLLTLFLLTLPLSGANGPLRCGLCGGLALSEAGPLSAAVPTLLGTTSDELAETVRRLEAVSPGQRRATSIVVELELTDSTPLEELEEQLASIAAAAARIAPLAGFGIDVRGGGEELHGYSIKRLSVIVQGSEIARQVILPARSTEELERLAGTGALAYVDVVLAERSVLTAVTAWLAENDPARRVHAVAPRLAANPLHDLAAALRDGASLAYLLSRDLDAEAAAVASFNEEMSGDFVADPASRARLLTSRGEPLTHHQPIAFVRGEDLRTLLITPGNPDEPSILVLPDSEPVNPRRVEADGASAITDTGSRNREYLIGLARSAAPFLITVDRPAMEELNITRETIDVATRRGLSVDEIIRNHQAWRSFQDSIQPPYIARNATHLRFAITAGEHLEATLAGDHFFDPPQLSDWVWEDLFINGVRWRYGRIPELPLIQPERVTQLPLDLHLTREYRYDLVGERRIDGYSAWEIRFEPPREAPADMPLYRGTVWIDQHSFARVRISMLQMNLSGEVLSNEETVDYQPFARSTHQPLTPAEMTARPARETLWLPAAVRAQQVLSTAGRATAVNRSTEFSNFRVSPSDFEQRHQSASLSPARMVRETDRGLRYLERRGDERVVKEEFDTSRLFLVGGIHHDNGLEYPVIPLGGINYFNFNLWNRGLQSNVFFAGPVLAVNLTNPSVRSTRFNFGGDFFGIALPFDNTMYRGGVEVEQEKVKALPVLLAGRAGHPIFNFGKIDFSIGMSHISYQRADTTAADFQVPSNTILFTPGVDVRYERQGWSASSFVEYGSRTRWEPWGNPDEFDASQKSYVRYGGSLGKAIYLPRFQRIGLQIDYLDGERLDRFSKYELGFFGAQRVRGIRSGSVRADRALIGHASYGFVISDQLRLEAFYDHALMSDSFAGLSSEPYQGVGIAGQLVGPWGTLVRLDLGRSIGRNAQDGIVASVMVLKILGN